MEVKSLSSAIIQIVERKLGMYASSYLGNDTYFFSEAINILISAVGEDYVQKEWEKKGRDWKKMSNRLKALNLICTETKIYYDLLQEKKLEKLPEKEVQKSVRKYFFKYASKIPIIQRDIYDLFILLVEITPIKNKTISSDAFKILEHQGIGKFDLTKRTFPDSGTLPR